jgi:hypothetical protein
MAEAIMMDGKTDMRVDFPRPRLTLKKNTILLTEYV